MVGAFLSDVIFNPFDAKDQPYFVSPSWVCLPEYPFSLSLSYPFSGIISEFFKVTKISYIQAMPVIWRILSCID